MNTRPRVKRQFRVETVPEEACYLISERELVVVEGDTALRVTPLLDGQRELDEVIDAVSPPVPAEQVVYLVDELIRRGRATWADPAAEPRETAFWDMADLDGDAAAAAVRGSPVRMLAIGNVAAARCRDSLEQAGIRVSDDCAADAALTVVISDDYLAPSLAEINRSQLRVGAPWLLAKPVGSMIWVGPIFQPGTGPCWACLAQRLRGLRPAVDYLEKRLDAGRPIRPPVADLAVTRSLAMNLVASEAAKWLAGIRQPGQHATFTLDLLTVEGHRHELRKRPQCPVCGNPGLTATQAAGPVILRSRPKAFTADGGHRAAHPENFIEQYSHLISPITGVVRELRKLDDAPPASGASEFVRAYMAGHNFARYTADLKSLRTGLRTQSAGKGMTDTQAKASAIGEAIERYCGVIQGDEARIVSTQKILGADAINLNSCQLYSDRQFARRRQTNAENMGFAFVCDPLDPAAPIEWSPVWSLTEQRHKYLPTAYLYYGYQLPPGHPRFAYAESNGNAAGTCMEDAVLQGFLELVERDSIAIWWYNRLRRPAVDLDSFGEEWLTRFREFYAAHHRDVWALDLMTDFGIPAFAAVSRRTDKPAEDILMAFGAHFNPRIALLRAFAEMNQFISSVISVKADGTGYAYQDEFQLAWWRKATVAEHPYLLPDSTQPAIRASSYADVSAHDLLSDVLTAQRLVQERGMEMLVLDQTRPDVGLPVAKVIVPGIRHFWTRFAPGRLYDIPVQLGWLSSPTPEEDLNPVPMFL